MPSLDILENRWRLLGDHRTSVFLSWPWISTWLNAVKSKCDISTLGFYTNTGELVGLALLVNTPTRRRMVFHRNIVTLNESLQKSINFTIEYNNVLHKPEFSNEVYYSLCDFIRYNKNHIHEIQFNFFDAEAIRQIEKIANQLGLSFQFDKSDPCNITELSAFDRVSDAYIKSLSKNRREQIRRSLKYFTGVGDPAFEVAKSSNEALSYFENLGHLHQEYWVAKGRSGVFSNPNWVSFHNNLISNHFENVFLARIQFGDHVCGYLYNLIDKDCMYSIQSGFNYGDNKHDRPGLISHYLAVLYAIDNGFRSYDFLSGDAQYKRSLGNSQNELFWATLQNPSLSIKLENFLMKYYRLIKGTK